MNTVFRERYTCTPYHKMFGRAHSTRFSILALFSDGEWKIDVTDTAALQRQVKAVVEAQTLLGKEVVAKVQHSRERQREG